MYFVIHKSVLTPFLDVSGPNDRGYQSFFQLNNIIDLQNRKKLRLGVTLRIL